MNRRSVRRSPRGAAVLTALALTAALAGCAGRAVASGLDDGMVVETDDGRLYLLWDDGKQRIQQPAALSDDDLVALGLRIGAPAPKRLTVGAAGTRFVLHPYDAPDARLYLEVDGVLHAVTPITTPAAALSERADLDELIVTRARLP